MITLPVKVSVTDKSRGIVAKRLGEIVYKESNFGPMKSCQGRQLEIKRDNTQMRGMVIPKLDLDSDTNHLTDSGSYGAFRG